MCNPVHHHVPVGFQNYARITTSVLILNTRIFDTSNGRCSAQRALLDVSRLSTCSGAAGAMLIAPLADIGRSLTDQQLAAEALYACAVHPQSHFVIVSDDQDFLPLVATLKRAGQRVTVVTSPQPQSPRDGNVVTKAADAWVKLNCITDKTHKNTEYGGRRSADLTSRNSRSGSSVGKSHACPVSPAGHSTGRCSSSLSRRSSARSCARSSSTCTVTFSTASVCMGEDLSALAAAGAAEALLAQEPVALETLPSKVRKYLWGKL